MELKELTIKTLELFSCQSTEELSPKLLDIELKNELEYYAKYEALIGDLSIDWLQKIFQYYEADRKEKKQDYTPYSLARFCGKLAKSDNENVVVDLCAGSGALTIQKWNLNNELHFICVEFDEKVIPFLIFNLAVRNINGYVIHSDALSGEVFNTYELKSGEKYSTVIKCSEVKIHGNSCISNPPFNIKWTLPVFAQMQPRFSQCELPPESNANYAFVLTALEYAENKASVILPNGVLSPSNEKEKEIIKYLVDKNLIESVILCPDKMFEATQIATCIITLNKNKKHTYISFVDMRKTYTEEIREQNGQFGGNCHENRTYNKIVKTFSDEQMQKAIESITERANIAEFSKSATLIEVAENDYNLSPARYIEFVNAPVKHRDYADIIDDINRVIKSRNVLKLTMSETVAKSLGLYELFLISKQSADNCDKMNEGLKCIGQKIEKDNYMSLTKNKNEIKFENNSKDEISSILLSIMQIWKSHIMYLNGEENRYLTELRDAMINDFMSGKLNPTD